jgi:membrane protease YdiL (CAAX protease family)
MAGGERLLREEDVAAAAAVLAPFVVAVAFLAWMAPATAAQRGAADPIVRTLDLGGGIAWVPVLGGLVCAAWLVARRPDAPALRRAAGWAVAGAVVTGVCVGALRLLLGAQLPAFVPPEESAAPGLTLGLAAGVLEEVVFRLGLLPLVYFRLAPRLPRAAPFVAAAIVGLLFALAHELPPAGGSFVAAHVVTRVVFPGVVMSLAFFWPSPSFLVAAHATAHLFIPLAFV